MTINTNRRRMLATIILANQLLPTLRHALAAAQADVDALRSGRREFYRGERASALLSVRRFRTQLSKAYERIALLAAGATFAEAGTTWRVRVSVQTFGSRDEMLGMQTATVYGPFETETEAALIAGAIDVVDDSDYRVAVEKVVEVVAFDPADAESIPF